VSAAPQKPPLQLTTMASLGSVVLSTLYNPPPPAPRRRRRSADSVPCPPQCPRHPQAPPSWRRFWLLARAPLRVHLGSSPRRHRRRGADIAAQRSAAWRRRGGARRARGVCVTWRTGPPALAPSLLPAAAAHDVAQRGGRAVITSVITALGLRVITPNAVAHNLGFLLAPSSANSGAGGPRAEPSCAMSASERHGQDSADFPAGGSGCLTMLRAVISHVTRHSRLRARRRRLAAVRSSASSAPSATRRAARRRRSPPPRAEPEVDATRCAARRRRAPRSAARGDGLGTGACSASRRAVLLRGPHSAAGAGQATGCRALAALRPGARDFACGPRRCMRHVLRRRPAGPGRRARGAA
jgi:hypothetical protein